MDQLSQIFQTIITIGGGAWLFTWLKEVVKETFRKIDDIDKRLTEIELERSFLEKHQRHSISNQSNTDSK